MELPEYVSRLIARLEEAGFEGWCVGGCVRDHLLGIAPHDFDLCTNALPPQLQALFSDHALVLAGLKHGTVGVITDGGVVEITTYRTEGDYADSRHPGWVEFVPELEQDLARRDFTVNAMAFSPSRGLRDPFGGEKDLREKVLRCVGDPEQRFREDALRILRGLRFAARFGLTIEEKTWQAMLACTPELDALARERVFTELCGLLLYTDDLLLQKAAPIVCRVIPELAPTVGFLQYNPHHAYDVYTHITHVVAGVPAVLELRLAALLHDMGKPGCFTRDDTGRGHFYGHAKLGKALAEGVLTRLKAPTALKEQVLWLIGHHMSFYEPERKILRRALSRHGIERLRLLLALQRSDMGGKGTGEDAAVLQDLTEIAQALEAVAAEAGELSIRSLAVDGKDLQALGIPPGPALGQVLKALLEAVVAEEAPNEKSALLALAKVLSEKTAPAD